MKKNVLFLLLLILTVGQLNAQEFKTGESIGKQVKNNSQPGMKYAPAAQPATRSPKTFTGSSLAGEIREGKYGPVQNASQSAPAARASSPKSSNVVLPSNRSAAELEQELKAAKATPSTQPPVQEEKNEAPKDKMVPVKKVQQ